MESGEWQGLPPRRPQNRSQPLSYVSHSLSTCPFVPITERQASYSTDQAKDLRDWAAAAKEDLGHVEEQLGRCLDALSRSDPDLGGIEKPLASMARMLRDTADQLDSQ